MFRDAATVDDEAILDCDVCVVGTGAAGVTTVAGLAGHGLRVIVLEAGGARPSVAAAGLALETTDLPVSTTSREIGFGGTTNSWWGKVGLLDEHDFLAKDWVPASGWPIARVDLLAHYRAACDLLGIPDLTRFEPPAPKRDQGLLLRTGALDVKTFFWSRQPPNFGEVYRRRLAGAAGITTLLNATVTEVVIDEGGRVDRVAVLGPGGRRFAVRPRATILACGGIENPRLLLDSTSRTPAGVGNDRDQVGRYYMDHPRGPFGTAAATPALSRLSPAYWSGKRYGAVRFRLGVSLSAAAQAEMRVLNSYVNLSPVYGDGGGVGAIRALYRRGPAALRDRATRRALAGGIPDIARYLLFKRYGRGSVRRVSIENYTEQEPRAENRVTLSDRRDRLGRRIAKVSYTQSELDRRTMRVLHETLDAELQARGMGRLAGRPFPGDDEPWPIRNDASHHMGGTRMGADPATSVVDRDGKVHGIEGLYVAGSSVFATGGSANPTLTIVALASRLAEHLRETLGRRAPGVALQTQAAAQAGGARNMRAEGR